MMIEVEAAFWNGDRLKSYNAWNKEMPIVVKGIGGNKNAFQLPPMVRVIIPTDYFNDEREGTAKIYINPNVALEKGLVLVSGVQLVKDDENVHLYIQNVSDSLVTIACGDLLAYIEE